jgi:hypothetical protein
LPIRTLEKHKRAARIIQTQNVAITKRQYGCPPVGPGKRGYRKSGFQYELAKPYGTFRRSVWVKPEINSLVHSLRSEKAATETVDNI